MLKRPVKEDLCIALECPDFRWRGCEILLTPTMVVVVTWKPCMNMSVPAPLQKASSSGWGSLVCCTAVVLVPHCHLQLGSMLAQFSVIVSAHVDIGSFMWTRMKNIKHQQIVRKLQMEADLCSTASAARWCRPWSLAGCRGGRGAPGSSSSSRPGHGSVSSTVNGSATSSSTSFAKSTTLNASPPLLEKSGQNIRSQLLGGL